MKLFLIDGHALIFKMYYAFLGRPMINSKGMDTSILFGFTKYLLELIEREKPSHLAVSFDPPGGTFRNVMYPAYKANRGETPQLVIEALEPLTKILEAMDIPVLMLKGYEADDVIGSAAKRFVKEGFDVYMVTPDKDYGQLVEPHIFQYRPGKSGEENEILGPEEICAKWGISRTGQVIDILAICGDTADNVPGVQGVGPVGAAKLLARYDSLENIYSHLAELTPRQQDLFRAAQDHISLSKELVTIKIDIPLDVSSKDLVMDTVITDKLQDIFALYEFGSLRKKLSQLFSGNAALKETALAPSAVKRPVEVSASAVAPAPVMAIDLVGDRLFVATSACVSSGHPSEFRKLLEDGNIVKSGFGIKAQMNSLSRDFSIGLAGRLKDAELMHYLLNPERPHQLEQLARTYLGMELGVEEANLATGSLFDDPLSVEGSDRLQEVWAIFQLAEALSKELDASPLLRKLYDEIEEPLVGVLSRMELAGVKVDVRSLNEFADGLRTAMLARENEVREIAGDGNLNVSSPKQIGTLIFEKLKLDPKAKKPSKGNWPTDEETLSELSDRSPVIDAILDFRGLKKLLSTYIEPFPAYISPLDGRVHTTFNQALTSTGRLSSSNPNLQNIPIRTEQGREIRKAFVPGKPGSVIMSSDYSQIELRIMAHLCGDSHLQEAFRSGVDVHSATASKIFGIPVEEVTPDQRRMAKTANFGIMYGISSFGLSQRLKCSRSEAKQLIDDYFESFPSIRSFIDSTIRLARENNYVETLFGRRRYIPDINSHNGNIRSVAERNAVNAPIQGSAADIIKIAMIRVDKCLRDAGLSARMVLQIHDELVLEVPEKEIETVRGILVREMENVVELSVPLTVECNYGSTWLEAH